MRLTATLDCEHGRAASATSRICSAGARPVAIVPHRFHQQRPRQRVARLRDRPAAVTVPAGVLPRDQAEMRHQRPPRRESLEIVELGKQQQRGQRVDAPEAP